jgi:hypothetical protein
MINRIEAVLKIHNEYPGIIAELRRMVSPSAMRGVPPT